MTPVTLFLTIACVAPGVASGADGSAYVGILVVAAAIVFAEVPKMANTRDKFAVLRAAKLGGVQGRGLFPIVPVIDGVVAVIDQRVCFQ